MVIKLPIPAEPSITNLQSGTTNTDLVILLMEMRLLLLILCFGNQWRDYCCRSRKVQRMPLARKNGSNSSSDNWMMTSLQNIPTQWECPKRRQVFVFTLKKVRAPTVVSWKEHSLGSGIQTALWCIATWLGERTSFLLIRWENRSYSRREIPPAPITHTAKSLHLHPQGCVFALVMMCELSSLLQGAWALSHQGKAISFTGISFLSCII